MVLALGMAIRSLSNARLINLISCRSVMDGVIDVLVRHGYLVVFGWVLADQIGLPLPAVPFLLAAGALDPKARLSVARVVAGGALNALASDTGRYWFNNAGGGPVLRWLRGVFAEPELSGPRSQ